MTSQPLAAVLWDMDGTLIDSEPLWLDAEIAMLQRFGCEMTPEIHDRLVGSGLWDAAEMFRELGVRMSADEIVAEWVAAVSHNLATGPLTWRPGARELLESLQNAGIPCVLVTMSVRALAEQVVSQLPPGTFAAIVAGDEVDHEKPHPQPYQLGAAAVGVRAHECLAFEDSPTGITSAVAAGAVTIGIEYLVSLAGVSAHARAASLTGLSAEHVQRMFDDMRSTVASPHEQIISLTGELA